MALKAVENGKATGSDEILPAFLKHLGVKSKNWLAKLHTNTSNSRVLQKLWRDVKVIVILKLGTMANPLVCKPATSQSHYFQQYT